MFFRFLIFINVESVLNTKNNKTFHKLTFIYVFLSFNNKINVDHLTNILF